MLPISFNTRLLSLTVFLFTVGAHTFAQGSSDAPPPPPPPPEDFLQQSVTDQIGTLPGVTLEKKIVDDGAAAQNVDRLLERAEEYWRYNLKDDFYAMYEMLLPESREERSFKDFTRLTRANITNFALKKVSVWGDGCAALVTQGRIKSDQMNLNGVSLRQRWVFQDGEWYLFMRSPKDYIPMFGMRNNAKKGPCPIPDELKPDMEEEKGQRAKRARHSL